MQKFFPWTAVAIAAGLAGCVEAPPRRVYITPPPAPQQAVQVVAYPTQGQTPQQLDRDRYECHNWAVSQSGFDPSVPGTAPRQQVVVVAGGPPPGAGVAGGAITGAVVGSLIAPPWRSGTGALIGAIAGATIGAVADSERAAQNREAVANAQAQVAAQSGASDQRADGYRRALTACLEGRGYSVK